MSEWADKFVPFSLFHVACVAACLAAMLAACGIGGWTRGTPFERRFRFGWGVLVLLFQLALTIQYAVPFRWDVSLPLQLCDLTGFIAGLSMIWPQRRLRTLLYFWGIGLSTQAFFTPIVQVGFAHPYFWSFWLWHMAIVGSAVYDVVIGGYRPGRRDLGFAVIAGLGYVVVAMAANTLIDGAHLLPAGQFSNYGYIGNTSPKNPTIIDHLGAWPRRIFLISAIVGADFILLWGAWPLARKLSGRVDPLTGLCAACGRDTRGFPSDSARPGCGAPPPPDH